MILLGFGGNLPFGNLAPQQTIQAALEKLSEFQVNIKKISPFYKSAPVPVSDQPWFVNGIAIIETQHDPKSLLQILIQTETLFGRKRSEKNAARTLDLDLLDYNGKNILNDVLQLPHPRMAQRAFVLLPLRDIAPEWKHPATGQGVHTLIEALKADEIAACIRQA